MDTGHVQGFTERSREFLDEGFGAVGAESDGSLDVQEAPANLVGIPAIAVPSGFSREKLPLSLQIMAPHFAERAMFRAAAAYEHETNYWRESPAAP